MNKITMTKKDIFKIILIVWVVLWVFFLAREDKDGQYGTLSYLYSHKYVDKARHIIGADLFDLLMFSRVNIPEGSSYELLGFKVFSIFEVRARYFLWPLQSVEKDSDFKIVYGKGFARIPGYNEYKRCGSSGRLLVREGLK